MGSRTEAKKFPKTALGSRTEAKKFPKTALGSRTEAKKFPKTALGSRTETKKFPNAALGSRSSIRKVFRGWWGKRSGGGDIHPGAEGLGGGVDDGVDAVCDDFVSSGGVGGFDEVEADDVGEDVAVFVEVEVAADALEIDGFVVDQFVAGGLDEVVGGVAEGDGGAFLFVEKARHDAAKGGAGEGGVGGEGGHGEEGNEGGVVGEGGGGEGGFAGELGGVALDVDGVVVGFKDVRGDAFDEGEDGVGGFGGE